MDSIISWAIITAAAWYFTIRFFLKVIDEKERRKNLD